MIQEASPKHHILHYDPDQQAVPMLVASDNEDIHNLVIIWQNGHSIAVDIICSPTPNVYLPERNYHTVPCFFEPGYKLEEGLSKCEKYIYNMIQAKFKPGDWVDGGCHQLPSIDKTTATCKGRAQSSLSLFHSAMTEIENARSRSEGNPGNTSAVETKDTEHASQDEDAAKRIISKLTKGIQEIMDDVPPMGPVDLSKELTDYPGGEGDDGTKLEEILWSNSVKKEKAGREAGQMKITIHPDPNTEKNQQRWQESGGFLNEIVNELSRYRGLLALVVYRGACRKNYTIYAASKKSSDRRARMVEKVVDGLLKLPIWVPLDTLVIFPPACLTYYQQTPKRTYADICQALKLNNFADWEFTEPELEERVWEFPLSLMVGKGKSEFQLPSRRGDVQHLVERNALQIIDVNGVRYLTDLITTASKETLDEDRRPGGDPQISGRETMTESWPTMQFTPVNQRNFGYQHSLDHRTSQKRPGSPLNGAIAVRPRLENNAATDPNSPAGMGLGSVRQFLRGSATPEVNLPNGQYSVNHDMTNASTGEAVGVVSTDAPSGQPAATVRSPDILLEAARALELAMLSAPTGQESRFWEPVVDISASVGGSEGLARELVDTTTDTSDEVRFMEFSDWVDWNCAATENFMEYES